MVFFFGSKQIYIQTYCSSTNMVQSNFFLRVSVDDAIAENNMLDPTFRIGASWQANKNFLLKVEN